MRDNGNAYRHRTAARSRWLRAYPGCGCTGPVDATYKAIDSIIGMKNNLLEFNVHAVTEGIDAIGEVTVRLQGENGSHHAFTSLKANRFSFAPMGVMGGYRYYRRQRQGIPGCVE